MQPTRKSGIRHFFDSLRQLQKQLPFVLGSAAQRAASPFGISMRRAAKPPLRNSRPVAGNLRATRRAAQKGRWAILPQQSCQSQISILTALPARRKRHIACDVLFPFMTKRIARSPRARMEKIPCRPDVCISMKSQHPKKGPAMAGGTFLWCAQTFWRVILMR